LIADTLLPDAQVMHRIRDPDAIRARTNIISLDFETDKHPVVPGEIAALLRYRSIQSENDRDFYCLPNTDAPHGVPGICSRIGLPRNNHPG